MRVIAALQADLDVTPIGAKSRLADELRGVPVLRRTVERIRTAPSIEKIFVLIPSSQRDRCARILEGTGAEIVPHDAGPSPWSALVRSARKWSLDGWRGGIGGATSFDEFFDGRLLEGLLKQFPADAVLVAPAAAPLIDPSLIEKLIAHRRADQEETHLAFTPVPPGLAGIILDAGLILQLAQSNLPIGWLFGYQPNVPRKDLIFQPCCMEAPPSLRFNSARLIADTDRSMHRLVDLLADHPDPDAETIGAWLSKRSEPGSQATSKLPHEVEIELTTDDPFPDAVLHPRGRRLAPRGPLDLKLAEKIAVELMNHDDALVVLGGFGDPLRHPGFLKCLSSLRPKSADAGGVYGVCVRTRGVDLTDEIIDAMIDARVDVLNVILDAWTPELFARLASPQRPTDASLESVLAKIERVTALREKRGSAVPIVVPEFTKAKLNVQEMDDFYDGWLRKLGAASLVGASNRAGQVTDHSLLNMAPSPREACRRIHARCLILADGSVVACDQDFQGANPLGNLREQSLGEIWNGTNFQHLRESHGLLNLRELTLCNTCNEWHRP